MTAPPPCPPVHQCQRRWQPLAVALLLVHLLAALVARGPQAALPALQQVLLAMLAARPRPALVTVVPLQLPLGLWRHWLPGPRASHLQRGARAVCCC